MSENGVQAFQSRCTKTHASPSSSDSSFRAFFAPPVPPLRFLEPDLPYLAANFSESARDISMEGKGDAPFR